MRPSGPGAVGPDFTQDLQGEVRWMTRMQQDLEGVQERAWEGKGPAGAKGCAVLSGLTAHLAEEDEEARDRKQFVEVN